MSLLPMQHLSGAFLNRRWAEKNTDEGSASFAMYHGMEEWSQSGYLFHSSLFARPQIRA